jgi:hypothetical protein
MLEIGHLAKDQVYITTTGPRRICKILEIGPIEVRENVELGKPPEVKTHQAASVQVTSPMFPIPGHVTEDEAIAIEAHRRQTKGNTGDDVWTEIWIDFLREKPSVENPKEPPKSWQRCLRVHDVIGRHGIHEGEGKGGSIKNQVIDGILIPSEDIHKLMFEAVELDELSQAEKEEALKKKAWREEYDRELKAKEEQKKKGDPALCKQWWPGTRLKMQLGLCSLPCPENTKDGTFAAKARTALTTYLNTIGINPWDVMFLPGDEFAEALVRAKGQAMRSAPVVINAKPLVTKHEEEAITA